MLPRSLSALVLVGACAGLWSAATPVSRAQEVTAAAPLSEADVRAYLMRIHSAASERNFQGVFVVSAGGAVSSARISHYCEGRNQYESIEAMDGQVRRIFRHNETVHTLWPGSKVALVEQRSSMTTFPGLLRGGEDRIVEFYDVMAQGVDRVADHEVDVLYLRPRDSQRYGHRLWSERSTGLLLRADVLDPHEQVLESSVFSEVRIGVKTHPESVLRLMKQLDGYRVVRPTLVPTDLEAEGWRLKAPVPGFRQVSCIKRSLAGVGDGAEAASGAPPQVLQSIFSDGMTSVSLFIEPYDPSRHQKAMMGASGATQTLTRRQGEVWVTVVGDVPAVTLKRFADALQPKK